MPDTTSTPSPHNTSPALPWLRVTAVSGFLFVALGAFGAHALREVLSTAAVETWGTASLYHAIHTLALGLVVLFLRNAPTRALRVAAWSFLSGVLLFSGSLYLLAVTGIRILGAITPLGGVAFLAGWVALFIAAPGVIPSFTASSRDFS